MKVGCIGLGDIARKAYLPVLGGLRGLDLHLHTRTPATLERVADGLRLPADRRHTDLDALPATADRLVLVAAVDPETDPDADLSGFTDARIRLLDARTTELGVLEVSDGRPGETALVLGSFRRRETGDWDFVLGGKGYGGGLEELVRDFGLDVE